MIKIPVVLFLVEGAVHLTTTDLVPIINDANVILALASVSLVPVSPVIQMEIDGWPDDPLILPIDEPGHVQGFYGCGLVDNGWTYPSRPRKWFVRDHQTPTDGKIGISPPLGRVTAHEVGHLLGLPHVEEPNNLMDTRDDHNHGEILTDSQRATAFTKAALLR